MSIRAFTCGRAFSTVVLTLALLLIGCDRSTIPAEPEAVTLSDVTIAASAWTLKAPMPTARSDFAIAAFKNAAGKTLIYVIGGVTANGNATAVVEAYDPVANTWTRKAPMPAHRFQTNGATVIGSKIYVVGGWESGWDASPTGGFWEYTPATNRWRTLDPGGPDSSPGSGCCADGASGVINGKLYIWEGNDSFTRLDRYDPATNTWTVDLTPNSYPWHAGGGGAVIGGKFYLFGGQDTDVLEAYDPATNAWTSKAPMYIGTNIGSAVLNGKLYVFGGQDSLGVLSRDVKIYNPATNTWSLGIPMPTTRTGMGAAAVTNSAGKRVAYVIGGTPSGSWTSFVKRNELFDPTVPNKPPVAVANGPYTGTVGQPVQFSAQGTFDPEGGWNGTWTFGDGTSYTGTFGNFASQNPTHTYTAAAIYPVTFTVTDATGATSTASTTASIQ